MSNIAEIDNLIARCHYCDDLEVAKSIQADAISVFKKLGCSNEIIQSCCNLDFGENIEILRIPMGHLGYCESPINQIKAFSSDLKELREILNEARTIIDRENNQKTQRWSLILAAIAAVGTIITLLFTIFDYLCNN
ncbi:MAG: hypothetical protein E7138_01700 [Rikenellaceae bacterium]|nr:hypothetical protein [Rikenellaceae bacterium]MBE6330629.1 hypothetical protein [Bacteroidales bacterium]